MDSCSSCCATGGSVCVSVCERWREVFRCRHVGCSAVGCRRRSTHEQRIGGCINKCLKTSRVFRSAVSLSSVVRIIARGRALCTASRVSVCTTALRGSASRDTMRAAHHRARLTHRPTGHRSPQYARESHDDTLLLATSRLFCVRSHSRLRSLITVTRDAGQRRVAPRITAQLRCTREKSQLLNVQNCARA